MAAHMCTTPCVAGSWRGPAATPRPGCSARSSTPSWSPSRACSGCSRPFRRTSPASRCRLGWTGMPCASRAWANESTHCGTRCRYYGDPVLTEIIVVTSGKGGVGKTTTSASIACGLASRGKKVAVIDFDIGLRNLDLIMGCERRVVYDFVNVINGECTLKQALIKDKRLETLFVLAASQTRDKDALTAEGVERVLQELRADGFDYVLCDSPAGIEKGAHLAMYFADRAIVVVNPEVSSVRDSDRILGLLASKTKLAEGG